MRSFMLVLSLAAAGCHWSLDDAPIDPKSNQLYFPTGIVMDPGGRYAYVANANADLAYGGGTLEVVDMVRFECTAARWRQQHAGGSKPPAACHPDDAAEQKARDTDSQAASCQLDPFDTSIVDCDETPFILQASTVKIGNFAGEIRMQRFADETHRRLFVLVRGDPSVTWVDVRFPGPLDKADPSDTYRPPTIDAPGVLQCVDNAKALASGAQLTQTRHPIPRGCDASHLVQEYKCQNLPSCLPGLMNDGTTQLATEPIGIQLDQGPTPDGKGYARLLLAHQSTGQISLIDLLPKPHIAYTSLPFFTPDANGNHGAFSLAQQHRHDATSAWYVTSDLFSEVDTFRVAQNDLVVAEDQISLQATYAFGNDVRDIQFEPSGDRAFITVNNPPQLAVMDTRVVPGMNGGLPIDEVVSVLDICEMPSHATQRRVLVPGAPGQPPQLKTRIYTVCFLENQVMVVDPDLPDVLGTIFSGIGGPNEIAFNFSDVDAEPLDQITQILPPRAYVTNFSNWSISVVDVEPGSATENRVIAQLGFPPTGLQPQ